MVLLKEQYRMHPDIAAWPSAYFYDGQLVTPPATHAQYSAAFHALAAFPPLAFYDCRSAHLAHNLLNRALIINHVCLNLNTMVRLILLGFGLPCKGPCNSSAFSEAVGRGTLMMTLCAGCCRGDC